MADAIRYFGGSGQLAVSSDAGMSVGVEGLEESLDLAGKTYVAKGSPQCGTIHCVVGFSQVDEARVSGDIELIRVGEDLMEGEELVGGAAATTEPVASIRAETLLRRFMAKTFPGMDSRLIPR